jgi:4-carboxymuconolactone decarboxylase
MRTTGGEAVTRLTEIETGAMTDEQRRFHDWMAAGPWERREGPFKVLLHAPGLAEAVNQVNQHLRSQGTLAKRIRELVILINARHWETEIEWLSHEPQARDAGLDDAVIAALAQGREPDFRADDEAAVHAFCRELLETRWVTDATFARARDAVGEVGLIEVVCTLGLYSTLSLVMNAFEVPLGPGMSTPIADRRGPGGPR